MDNNSIAHLSKIKLKHEAYCLCMAGYYIYIFINEKNIPFDVIKYYGEIFLRKENLYLRYFLLHDQKAYALNHDQEK